MHYLSHSHNALLVVDNPLRNEYRRRRRQNLRLSARLAVKDLPDVDDPHFASTSAATLDSEIQSLSPAQLHELQQNLLEDAAQERPLIGVLSPLDELRAEYEGGSTSFVKQIDWLQRERKFKGIRRTRGDGDCFYRSLGFSYIEKLLRAPDVALAVTMSLSTLEATRDLLKAADFDAIVYDDFYGIFVSCVQQIVTPDKDDGHLLTAAILLEAFQDPSVSNSIITYLRLLTSAQLKSDPDNYAPFLFHQDTFEPMSVQEFCQTSVEPLGREADHVQISALSRALNVNVKVAYLDGRGNGEKVDFVELKHVEDGHNGMHDVVLLYRPGHYDILEYRDTDD
ncbi:cysteine proteinase [Hysterangium stoloniferum]|nr:cysteine proteinase [Hysterangium stoloniferum]